MKLAKRILTAALALMLIFAMSAPGFALQTSGYVPTLNGLPYYIQNTNTNVYKVNGTFTVYLSIYSGMYDNNGPINTILPVSMGASGVFGAKYTVAQVLTAAQSQYPNVIAFDTTTPDPTHYHSSYLFGVEQTSVTPSVSYTALPLVSGSQICYSGWMFRINGMIPFYTHTVGNETVTEGCLITDAYVTKNDVIDLYYDNMYTQSLATKVIAIAYLGTSNGNATFQVLGSESYCNSLGQNWTVTNWAKVTNSTMTVIIDGVSTSVTTDNNGQFTTSSYSNGFHTIQFSSTMFSTAFTYNDGQTTHYYNVPNYVGMYCRFSA